MRERQQTPDNQPDGPGLLLMDSARQIPDVQRQIELECLRLPARQPRRYFDAREMDQMVDSVRKHGILQPLMVRPLSAGIYELVAGERRYRAALEVGLSVVPVLIRAMSAEQAAEYALVENLQRANLNPLEETEGILRLLALKLNCSEKQIASLLYQMHNAAKGNLQVLEETHGTVRRTFEDLGTMTWESFLKNRLPLLNLPADIFEPLREGKLAYTKAKALARVKDRGQREALLRECLEKNLPLSKIRSLVEALSPDRDMEADRQRVELFYRSLKKQRIWENPEKRERLLELLDQLESIMET